MAITPETRPAFTHINPKEFSFQPQNFELNHNFSRETVINAGIKVTAAAILTIGLYKVVTAESITDLVIGGVLMYAGYKILTHKPKKQPSNT